MFLSLISLLNSQVTWFLPKVKLFVNTLNVDTNTLNKVFEYWCSWNLFSWVSFAQVTGIRWKWVYQEPCIHLLFLNLQKFHTVGKLEPFDESCVSLHLFSFIRRPWWCRCQHSTGEVEHYLRLVPVGELYI